jgi:hypothetical protein
MFRVATLIFALDFFPLRRLALDGVCVGLGGESCPLLDGVGLTLGSVGGQEAGLSGGALLSGALYSHVVEELARVGEEGLVSALRCPSPFPANPSLRG